jgi:hypothetical protein
MKIFHLLALLIMIILLFYFINKNLINYENFFIENLDYVLPKEIYCYWDNIENNDLVKAHINTWKNNIMKDWNINIISKNNINQYVDNDFLEKYSDLSPVRFSDFLRVYLLSKKGGVWIDATTIVINGEFLNIYYNEMIKNKYDVTLYEFKPHSLKNQPYLENWFFMAPKNSKFIGDLYNEFNRAFEMNFLNYKNDILKNEINLENSLKNGKKTYHMQHAIIHYLLKKNNYNLNIKDAEESMFKIHKDNFWNSDKIIDFIINNDDWSNYYAVKLVSFNRKSINNKNRINFINKLNNL